MITIICGTHRPKNVTRKIVDKYYDLLKLKGEEPSLFEMSELPADFLVNDSFGKRSPATEEIIKHKIMPADKLVIISPEYNGSYPGVLKTFFDGVNPKLWKGKKVALVGVASGRAGNIRGMDHLTHVLHHLRMEVFSLKVPVSQVDGLLDSNGLLIDEPTIGSLESQIDEFLKY
jgi:chromate reductase